jgi:hypothetical protein
MLIRSLTLSSTSTHTTTCTCSRTPSGIERSQAKSGVCASAWQCQARHHSEPCPTPRQGLESNTLVDRTRPSEPQGSGGARHLERPASVELIREDRR